MSDELEIARKNNRILETARQEEMKKRDAAGSTKWKARIVLNGNLIQLGRFDTAEEAHQAYLTKKREIHEGCTL